MRLFTFYRSLASWRVRIALALKGLEAELIPVDLLAGEQHKDDFASANPEASVPLLEIDGLRLAQSMAILEYLEETRPRPALLPEDPPARALARRLCLISAADSHPLVVPRVRAHLAGTLSLDDDGIHAWARHWMMRGCGAMESVIAANGLGTGRFLFGDTPGMAEACLLPHLFGTRAFGGDASAYPTLIRVEAACMELAPFSATHPRTQPDFPNATQ